MILTPNAQVDRSIALPGCQVCAVSSAHLFGHCLLWVSVLHLAVVSFPLGLREVEPCSIVPEPRISFLHWCTLCLPVPLANVEKAVTTFDVFCDQKISDCSRETLVYQQHFRSQSGRWVRHHHRTWTRSSPKRSCPNAEAAVSFEWHNECVNSYIWADHCAVNKHQILGSHGRLLSVLALFGRSPKFRKLFASLRFEWVSTL